MKKSIIAIAAIVLTAATVTVVSCNKDTEPAQKINTTSVTMKCAAGYDQLGERLNQFFAACDEAYRADEGAFLAACNEGDESAFMELTGMTEEYLAEFCETAEEWLAGNGEWSVESGEQGVENALKVIAELAADTKGEMAKLMPESLLDYDYYYLYDAIYHYKSESHFKMATGVAAELGEYFKEIQKESLNTELQVAKLNGEPKEGENLTLSFDENKFKEGYEKALKKKTGKEWVAEEVTAFFFLDKECGELMPVMKIAAFNLDDESSATLYLVSKARPTGNNMFSLVGRDVVTIECVKKSGCGGDGECQLQAFGGQYYCTPCASGECEKRSKVTSSLVSACDVMFSLLY